ncbi:MAG: hypothetical protein IT379_34755 [Deltaproteobacteria bacterium]|nr:hypothetical protein [Deltaproteobacteria bacterium]
MRRGLVPAWVGLLVVVGCGDDDGGGRPCTTSADCPAEMTCVDGRCSARVDAGPRPDLGPIDGDVIDGAPVPPPPVDLGPLPDVELPDLGPIDLGPDPIDLGSETGPIDMGADLGPPPDAGPTRYPDGDDDRLPDALDRCPAVPDPMAFYEGFELADGWGATARGPLPARFAPWPSIGIPTSFVAGPALASSLEPGTLELQATALDSATEALAGGAASTTAVPSRGRLSVDFETVLAAGNASIAVGLFNAGAATPTRGLWCGLRRSGMGAVVAREIAVWLNVQSSPLALGDSMDAPARGRLELTYDLDARTATCALGPSSVTVPATGAVVATGVAVTVVVGAGASDARARFDDLTLQAVSPACP